MTVQSIDKRLTPDTNLTPASDKAPSAAEAFSQVLQNTTFNFSAGSSASPEAGKVLSKSLDRPQAETVKRSEPEREREQPHKAERASRKADGDASRKAERAERPEAPRADTAAEDRPVEDSAETGTVESVAETAQDTQPQQTAETATDDTAAAAQPDQDSAQQSANLAAAVTQTLAPVQQAAATQATQAASSGPEESVEGETETQDPFAWLDRDHGDQIAKLQSQLNAGDAAQGSDGDDQLLADALSLAAGPRQAKAAGPQTAQAEGKQENLAQSQAQDMAEMLGDSDVHLAVQVKTANGPDQSTQTASADAAQDGLALFDDVLPQQPGATANGPQSAPLSPTSQSGQTNAAQQAQPQNPAAMQAEQKPVDAKAFAAALAAQVETGAKAEAAAPTTAQPVASVGTAAGTQAASRTTQAQAAQTPHQPRAVPQQEVIEQIQVQINKQVKDGADQIKIQLKPVELGSIEIKLEVAQDGRVSATVTADNKDTLAMLQKDQRGLEKALSDAGLKTDGSAMNFGLKGDQQQAQNDSGADRRGGRGRRVKTGIDATQEATLAAQAAQARALGGRSGVNIQV